jgi:hypothetical protein
MSCGAWNVERSVRDINSTPGVRHAQMFESAVHAIRKELTLSSDGGDSVNKKCKRG